MESSNQSSEITVCFKAETKPQKCCEPGNSRFSINAVHVCQTHDGNVWLTSTDGRHLAAVLASGEAQAPALCPASIIPAPSRNSGKVTLNGRWENDRGKFADKVDGRFPNVPAVMPDICENQTRPLIALTINGDYLANLKAALNADNQGITLLFRLPDHDTGGKYSPRAVNSAVAVVGQNGIGVLMPIAASSESVLVSEANEAADRYEKLRKIYTEDFKQV